jgi:putative sigma-54 modulation protein
MKVTYTGGIGALTAPLQKKLEDRFVKLGKLLDGKGEKSAHVALKSERHLNHAEIQVNYYGHALVGLAKDADLFSSISGAVEKLEKQVMKNKTKWRDNKRGPQVKAAAAIPAVQSAAAPASKAQARKVAAAANSTAKPKPKVYRVNHREDRKPMTLEEAILSAADGQDYVVYQDASTDRTSVLVRRPDGHFDLIES